MNEYDVVVEQVERQPGVLGAMLVGMDDGMVIARTEGLGSSWEPAAALASSLFRKTRQASCASRLIGATSARPQAVRSCSWR